MATVSGKSGLPACSSMIFITAAEKNKKKQKDITKPNDWNGEKENPKAYNNKDYEVNLV